MIKLKLKGPLPGAGSNNASQNQNQNQNQIQPAPAPAPQDNTAGAPPTPSTATSSGGFKLKLHNTSQPPTPVEKPPHAAFPPAPEAADGKKKRTYQRKQDGAPKGKKRAADDDNISPAAKRIASDAGPSVQRKFSLKLGSSSKPALPAEATPKITLGKPKKQVPKLIDIRARGKAPPRPKGVGYDSEDSDVEEDPAIQQALVLRMEEGEDANYLREAIASGKIGPHSSQGDAEVSMKFIDRTLRRAVIKIRGKMYAAALVDLPCIVESMKSFDKKGWWKVADIAQMLLVLGRCNSEEEARLMPTPRDVKNNQYAHGLTPPMRYVRKRRFRKRINYNDKLSVEEEVARLLSLDKECEDNGGTVELDKGDRAEQEQSMEPQDEYSPDEDADGAIETVERYGNEYDMAEEEDEEQAQDEIDAEALAAQMQAEFDQDQDDTSFGVTDLIAESPAPIVEQVGTMAAVENAMMESEAEATSVGTPAGDNQDEEESEEESDEDDDDDELDVVDEDAVAKAAERAQQMEEVADLEREVEWARQKVKAMTNQLLRQREMQKLSALEEDLRVKRSIFNLEAED